MEENLYNDKLLDARRNLTNNAAVSKKIPARFSQ